MMTRTVSTLAALACFMPLAACANMEGDWPSLKTPAERQAGTCNDQVALAEPQSIAALTQGTGTQATGIQAASPAVAAQPTGASVAAPNVAAVATRLAEEQRDFNAAQESWNKQRTAAEAAANAARNAAPASEAWATAEMELTRFNQSAARFEQIRDAVTRVTGDLAVLAASGVDVSATLREAGQLLRRIDEATAAHQSAVGPLQASQPR